MRRLIAALVGSLSLAVLVLALQSRSGVQADELPDKTTTSVAGPVITAVVTVPGGQDPGGPPVTVEVPCSWFGFVASDEDADRYNEITQDLIDIINDIVNINLVMTITYYSEDGLLHRWNDRIGDFEQHQIADCSRATAANGVVTGDGRWVVVGPPSPAILLPGTTSQATRAITPPAPAISPPDRSAVNLGLWLAVESVGPISVEARLGPLWARTTATQVSTSFDPGTGDAPIVCPGVGTPIPDGEKNSIEQGPCGYTYTADTNGETVSMTITTTWTVTWELSDGTTGREPDIVVTTVLPFEVYEIQTIGTDG